MNLRAVVTLALFGLLNLAVTRSHPFDSTSYVDYRASHGGASWRGLAPVDFNVVTVEGGRLELKAVVKSASFDSGNLMRDGLASAVVFESTIYPDIIFTASVDTTALTDDIQQINVTGTLLMHGVMKEIATVVTLERDNTRLRATGTFEVRLRDYQMTRPLIAGSPISDTVTVTFTIEFELEQIECVLSYF